MLIDENEARKALVSVVIEKSLLIFGKPVYEKVIEILKKEYKCYLPDCYENPEYLREILERLYGNAHKTIIESINKELEEFSYQKPIARVLEAICK